MSIAMLYDEYSYAELSVPSRYTFLVPFFKSLYNMSRIDVSCLCIWRMSRKWGMVRDEFAGNGNKKRVCFLAWKKVPGMGINGRKE